MPIGVAPFANPDGRFAPPNGPGAVHEITYGGQVMYWVVFCCMAFSAMAFATITFMKPMHMRAHGYITTAIVTIAAIAYYVMGALGGSADILNPDGNLRSIYYARYVDWFFTTPLILLDVILMGNVALGCTLWIILADVAMICTGLFGALSINNYRWGYYTISCLFFLIVLWGLVSPVARGARQVGGRHNSIFWTLTGLLIFLWIGYPIVWGFCEGSDYATVSTEAICYGTLDFFAKVVFGWIVIVNLDLLSAGSKDGRSVLCNSTNNPFGGAGSSADIGGGNGMRAGNGGATGTGTGTTGVGTTGARTTTGPTTTGTTGATAV
jgi:bacteriorhodopsin